VFAKYVSEYVSKAIDFSCHYVFIIIYIKRKEKKKEPLKGDTLYCSIMKYIPKYISIVCDVHRWIRELFMTGAKRDLEESDIYRPIRADESEKLTDHLEK